MTDTLSVQAIQERLCTKYFGKNISYFVETTSTMDRAAEAAKQGAVEGTVVITEEQTAGRGRLKRTWSAPAGSSVLMTPILRPSFELLGKLALMAALAVVDAIESTTGLRAGIKWPNDILINSKKVSGILVESEIKGQEVEYAAIGIGINVNFDATALPDVIYPPTSLQLELGRSVDRVDLVAALLNALEQRYEDLKAGKPIYQEWSKRLTIIGQQVRATSASGVEEGIAEAVDDTGALLLRRSDGALIRILAADVTLRA